MPNRRAFISMDDVYTRPGYLFRRMQQIAVSIFVEECAAFDLTPVQYAALVAIQTHPGIDATCLSLVIAFDRSTLGSVLERLETKNYIERRAGTADRRVKSLHLTPFGRTMLKRIRDPVDRAQERMLAPLEPSERDTLIKLLARLVELNNETSRVPLRPEDALRRLSRSSDVA